MEQEQLKGLSLEEAIEKIKTKNAVYRILSIDNKPLIITCDYNPERLNLKIEDGVIVEVTGG